MTENNKNTLCGVKKIYDGLSKFRMEAERGGEGLRIRLSGIVGVNEFSNECVQIKSHSGRVTISGERLSMDVCENNQVEIYGKVLSIGFNYGKI